MRNLITCLSVCVLSGAALADTWTVDDDGKADFDNIQSAIDVASDGDEILVYPGIYTGTGANSNVIQYLNKNIAIESTNGAAVTIIDGENLRRAVQCFASGSLNGFTLTNGYHTGRGGGLSVGGPNSPTISNCLIEFNSSPDGGGVSVRNQSTPSFLNCTIVNNTANQGGGVYIVSPGVAAFMGCSIQDNTADYGGGIFNDATTITISGSTVCSNTPDQLNGSYQDGGGNCVSEICDSDSDGVYDCIDQCPGEADIDSDGDGIMDCVDQCPGEDDIDSDGDGVMDCVDDCPDWPGACSSDGQTIYVIAGESIQAAIDVAPAGGVVSIEGGSWYAGSINPQGKAITIIGIDDEWGQKPHLTSDDGTSVLVCESGETSSTVFENLHIEGGDATYGGGMYNLQSSPTVRHCTFWQNSASVHGGAVYNVNSSATFEYCYFGNCSGGGNGNGGAMSNGYESSVTLLNCIFEQNQSHNGGAIANDDKSFVTATNCEFRWNGASGNGGAVLCVVQGGSGIWVHSTFENCIFEENQAENGGGIFADTMSTNETNLELLNCTFTGNIATASGGGVRIEIGSLVATDCIFTNNSAAVSGGGMKIVYDHGTILTSVLVCGNSPDQIDSAGHQDGGGNCVSEICDSDSDGVYDCIDQCPGVDDIDSDGDGVMDCIDQCPGEDDIDSDGDGVMDCIDGCPDDPNKSDPGQCGCDEVDTDTDNDGVADCVDDCPDWPGACSSDGQTIYVIAGESIQAAIDVAPAGGVVSIEGGSWYAGSINPQGKAITIIGIDDEWGQKPHLTSDDGTSVLVCESGETSSTVFENLHIEGGDATYGGGMYNLQSSPTVRHCTFWQNSASVHGGAVYNVNSSATFEYCYFGNCSGGGNGNGGAMSNGYESSVTLLNCIFEQNQSHNGGAIANDDKSFVTATNCEFRWNGASGNGGAVLCVVQGGSGIWVHSTFENCIFEENQAENGGGIFADTMSTNETNLELLNCTFTGNIATASGGGVRIEIGSLVATDCIFTNNSAAVSGGGMKIVYDHGTILTSVLVCGNSPDQIDSAGHQDGGGNCVSEICDSDSDGVYDCIDQCPGVDDIDSDGDGVMDCIDQCPGEDDIDSDGDGVMDCIDGCPDDPNKSDPGQCGCDEVDTDTDNDGVADCVDDCPDWPGACSSDGQTIYVIAGESIQAAIDVAPAGGVVSIEGGSWYAGSINPQGKAITIIGIDDEWGQKPHLTSDDGTSVLVCESGETSSTVFENLHIEGGDATYGGGMYNLQSSPTVRHCTFWQNSASVHGGAVYNVNSSATFEYCYFGNCSGGGNGNGGAMSNGYESSVTLLNCIFEQNQSHNGGAIANDDKSFVTATNCEFRWNGASGNGGAVLCVVQGGSGIWVHSTFENCIFEENQAENGGGIFADTMSTNETNLELLNCTFTGNIATASGGGVRIEIGSLVATDCIFTNNSAAVSGGGMKIVYDHGTILTSVLVCGNSPDQIDSAGHQDGGGNCVSEICDSDSDGVYDCIDQCPGVDDIDSDGDGVMDCIDQCPGEDDIDSDGDGVMDCIDGCPDDPNKSDPGQCGCDEVDTDTDNDGVADCVDDCPDWPGACSSDGQTIYVIAGESIQAAIDVAPAGGVVSIEGGSWYAGSINPQGKAITIIGIDDEWGQKPHLTSDDGTSVLVCESGETSSTVFENLHIEGGDATYGGGMYNLQSSPTVRHCTFWQNSASVHGGAVYNVNSSATFEYCYFGNCSGGGNGNGGAMSNGYESSVTLLNCIFEQNQSHNGGAIANDDKSFVTATNCEFRWNGASGNGGAVLCVVQGGSGIWVHSTFENCIFEENQAENGGGIFADTMSTNETNLELLNCTFTGNIATASGGGVRIEIGSLVATDCIFTNNSAAVSGGGMKIVYDHGTILTSVLVCGNSPDQIDSAGHQDGGGNCVSEICDSDSDGVYDCIDQCPGVDDIDSDGDGVMDCIDQCPNDPNKVYPDVCGCGVPDEDVDENGIIDCLEPDCVTDLDADGDVDVADLLTLIAAWGTCDGCSADFDGDNDVDVADLLTLIAAWGACP